MQINANEKKQINVLVFAGTKNGRELISLLANKGYTVFASSMSEYGDQLLEKNKNIKSDFGRKDINEIKKIINDNKIHVVIDSTHPYAKEISINISKACEVVKVPCVRFDRKSSIPIDVGLHFDTLEEICQYLSNKKGNILFTTGVNEVQIVVKYININRIFLRIIPVESSINKVKFYGLLKKQVIIKKPPFSLVENIGHINEFNIKYLVTKDSGQEGNTCEKIEAVKSTNIELLVINRPISKQSNVFYCKEDVLNYLETYL